MNTAIEDFNCLPDQEKKQLLVDAQKIAERFEHSVRFEFFRLNDFYIEVKTSFERQYRVISNVYALQNVPSIYADKVTQSL